jgi:hypothetical protein
MSDTPTSATFQRTFTADDLRESSEAALITRVQHEAEANGLTVHSGSGRVIQQGQTVRVTVIAESAQDVDLRE